MQKAFPTLLLGVLLATCGLLAQTSHRRPNPQPPRGPNDIFNQLETQKAEPLKEGSPQAVASRQQRSANRAELEPELPRLVELAQGLQEGPQVADLETAFAADLKRQARELEQIARRIHKQIGSL